MMKDQKEPLESKFAMAIIPYAPETLTQRKRAFNHQRFHNLLKRFNSYDNDIIRSIINMLMSLCYPNLCRNIVAQKPRC